MIINTLDNAVDTSTLLNTEVFERNFPGKLNDKDVYGFIYKITNKENGRIYIGKTKDVKRRAREYIVAAINPNLKKNKAFCKIAASEGIDKFVMEPIDIAYNSDDLAILELDYILSYHATDPTIGYNLTVQSVITPNTVHQKARIQYADELMKRSKIICGVNLHTKYILFSTGLKLFGDTIHRSKDEVKSAARRCATLEGFMLYYINNTDYEAQLKFFSTHKPKTSRPDSKILESNLFIKYREYVMNYVITGENPEGFLIRFIHQSDTAECGYEYETDLTDLRNYIVAVTK